MQNINPEQILDYVNHVVSFDRATKLTFVTIAKCICHTTLQITNHSSNYSFHCLKCRVYSILITVLFQRGRKKLLLLVNTSNYQTVSEETLYDNFSISGN